MKNVVLIFCLFAFSLSYAQTGSAIVYAESFELAQEQAKKENKDVLLVFAGTDWCRPCIIFEKNILEDANFMAFAEKHLVIYKAEFPRKQRNALPKEKEEYNNKLAAQYNQTGAFPKIILFSNQFKTKTALSHARMTSKEFVAQIKNILK